MRRKTFDALVAAGGLVVAAVLLLAGSLLLWGHNFVDTQVRSQLSQQQIFFPAAGSAAISDPLIAPYLTKYAGQQLVTGAQAQAFADHYIAVHLEKSGGGLTYAQLSAAARTNPTDTTLPGKVETSFKGETLRGLLLNAYAFWKVGQIAMYAAFVCFGGAALMLILSGLGFAHARRVSPAAEILVPKVAEPAVHV